MLHCLLFKTFQKFIEYCPVSKTDRMSSICLKENLVSSDYIYFRLRFVEIHANISKDRNCKRTHGCYINLIVKFTVKQHESAV